MPLFKYTTQIDADKTAANITRMLSKAGARSVLTEYDEEGAYITSISFKINTGDQDLFIKLPCNWRAVLTILIDDRKVPSKYKTSDQAIRVSWKIIEAWVQAQVAIIQTNMVRTEEIFLPYIVTRDGQTLFEKIKGQQYLLSSGN